MATAVLTQCHRDCQWQCQCQLESSQPIRRAPASRWSGSACGLPLTRSASGPKPPYLTGASASAGASERSAAYTHRISHACQRRSASIGAMSADWKRRACKAMSLRLRVEHGRKCTCSCDAASRQRRPHAHSGHSHHAMATETPRSGSPCNMPSHARTRAAPPKPQHDARASRTHSRSESMRRAVRDSMLATAPRWCADRAL